MKELILFRPDHASPVYCEVREADWYAAVRDAVGGLIQQVPGFSRLDGRVVTVWVNEEGIPLRLPQNDAFESYLDQHQHNWRSRQFLLGPVVISRRMK